MMILENNILRFRAWFALFAILAALIWAAHAYGLRVNLTPSVKGVFWRLAPSVAIERGHYVIVCLSTDFVQAHALTMHFEQHDTDKCGGIPPLLKQVIGVAGDQVRMSRNGLHVNGIALPSSIPLGTTAAYSQTDYTVDRGHLVLIGEDARSLDSRYFGPVTEESIVSVAVRIF